MALSKELVSQFAKVVNSDDKRTNSEQTLFGTIVDYDGKKYMRIDGSDQLTPISSTTNVEADERVTGIIKNHSLIVTGNLSSPSARTSEVELIGTKISEFEIIVADKVSVKELDAANGRIDNLVSDNVTIRGTLEANTADIRELEADNVTIKDTLSAANADITDLKAENVEITGKLEAADADIDSLQADNVIIRNTLTANEASINEITAKNVEIEGHLSANTAAIENLEVTKLSASEVDLRYANIDFSNIGKAAMEYFYAESGLIKNVTVGDQTITGNLVGVTISGDLIEGNTIVAEKLVIKGDDGLYYKLNTDGIKTEAEQTDYNSLNGSVIRAKSVTAEKISVADLVAFGATIGGFKITTDSIHSTVKETVDNTTRGIYLDNDGQVAFGDSENFIKFFKDTDDVYKLIVSADRLTFGSNHINVEDGISNAETLASDAQTSADTNAAELANAKLDIDTLNATMKSLVTGENGESLMTQTENGWTFNISSMQNTLNNMSSNVSTLGEDMNNVNNTINAMNQSIADLGVYTEYIKFGVDNGKPCIILGETDSNFKVMITNTDIRFMEGTHVPASISNQALNIETAVVNKELQQGGYAWTSRSNNHYSLVWKGVT